MPWAKIDDDAPTHPKMFRAGVEAFGFWVAGNCYCNKRLTDGFIAADALPLIFPSTSKRRSLIYADRLVEVGLWDRVDGGWNVHDFNEYNPTAIDVKAERKASADRIKRWRDKKRSNASRNGVTDDTGNGASNTVTPNGVTPSVTSPPRARSSRPDPTYTPIPPPLTCVTGSNEYPAELFNTDCPAPHQQWRGSYCVSSAYLAEHPDLRRYPATDAQGTPKQCPWHHAHPGPA